MMPIKIPDSLPAQEILRAEGVALISESDAVRQDIRPMRIALLNLMPDKSKTETHIARLLGHSPLQIEMTLLTPASHTPRRASREHLLTFYEDWRSASARKFDGLIITGAAVETLPFEDVYYWDELGTILDWSLSHVTMTFTICWAAQAALYHFYGIEKRLLQQKLSGIYTHQIASPSSWLLRGVNDRVPVPVSRYTTVEQKDIDRCDSLETVVLSPEIGPCLIQDREKRFTYMLNHLEYDALTLREEYLRDCRRGLNPEVPVHYFPDDDPEQKPVNSWRSAAHLVFRNWLDAVYWSTPYDTDSIGLKLMRGPNPDRPEPVPAEKEDAPTNTMFSLVKNAPL